MSGALINAVVSGRAGAALLVDGERLHSLHSEHPDELASCRAEDYNHLFGNSRDLEFLEDLTQDDVRTHLALAVDREECVDLFLLLFDAELPDAIRVEAANELVPLLEQEATRQVLQAVFFSKPLPRGTDTQPAFDACEDVPVAREFLGELLGLQPAIESVFKSWSIAAEETFASDELCVLAESVCVREGLFREFVQAVARGRQPSASQIATMQNRTLNRHVGPQLAKQFIDNWCKLLSGDTERHPDPDAADRARLWRSVLAAHNGLSELDKTVLTDIWSSDRHDNRFAVLSVHRYLQSSEPVLRTLTRDPRSSVLLFVPGSNDNLEVSYPPGVLNTSLADIAMVLEPAVLESESPLVYPHADSLSGGDHILKAQSICALAAHPVRVKCDEPTVVGVIAILAYRDWATIISEQAIPLLERIAMTVERIIEVGQRHSPIERESDASESPRK